jgi:xanthine dehydrogenase accessory factor
MQDVLAPVILPTPVRAMLSDDPADILGFAVEHFQAGEAVALATLVDIRGGAARALGSHVAITADGRFCGYVSGGCIEAAVAAEAMLAMAEGRDRTVLLGDGSPFMDIILPCGGGISVAIHLLRDSAPIEDVLECLVMRRAAGLQYRPDDQSLQIAQASQRACWRGRDFITAYRPRTRLIISGESIEAQAVARLAEASGYEVILIGSGTSRANLQAMIDPFTAAIALHHDLDRETPMLQAALDTSGFYIGAMGSTRTHRLRIDRLKVLGYTDRDLQRIKAPIGVFGPARDSSSLALSVVADVAASRLMAYA